MFALFYSLIYLLNLILGDTDTHLAYFLKGITKQGGCKLITELKPGGSMSVGTLCDITEG